VAEFRLMTWNVENLLAVGAEGGPGTQQELDAKLDSLAAVINAQQPDVLALKRSASRSCWPPSSSSSLPRWPTASSPASPMGAASRWRS
jgi:hypothetical protein